MAKPKTFEQAVKELQDDPQPPALPKIKAPQKKRMITPHKNSSCPKLALFVWDEQSTEVAKMLAQGYTIIETSRATKVPERTIKYWKSASIDFAREVDNLSLMIGIASKAERVRIAQAMVRKLIRKKKPTEKDLLDWLKYAQLEQEGAKVDISGIVKLLNASDNAIPSPITGSGQDTTEQPPEDKDDKAN